MLKPGVLGIRKSSASFPPLTTGHSKSNAVPATPFSSPVHISTVPSIQSTDAPSIATTSTNTHPICCSRRIQYLRLRVLLFPRRNAFPETTPMWLRQPVSSSFGFGEKVTISNVPGAWGYNWSRSAHLMGVVTEEDVVGRARAFQTAIDAGEEDLIKVFAEGKVKAKPDSGSREEAVTLLGYKKSEKRKITRKGSSE